MPSTSRCGVDSALPKVSLPVLSSKAAMSVKVPPMSAASRRPEPLAFDATRCFMVRSMIARYAPRTRWAPSPQRWLSYSPPPRPRPALRGMSRPCANLLKYRDVFLVEILDRRVEPSDRFGVWLVRWWSDLDAPRGIGSWPEPSGRRTFVRTRPVVLPPRRARGRYSPRARGHRGPGRQGPWPVQIPSSHRRLSQLTSLLSQLTSLKLAAVSRCANDTVPALASSSAAPG